MEQEYVSDPKAITEIARSLIDSWDGHEGKREFAQRGQAPSPARFVTIYGLTAHAYRLGSVVLDLLDDGRELECFPVLRLAYECAIKTQWVAQAGDGAEAFVNESLRQRRAAAKTLAAGGSEIMRDAGQRMLSEEDENHATSSNAQARYFEQMCTDLTPGGHELYAYFRLLSGYSHATAYIIDAYIDPTPDRRNVRALRQHAQPSDGTTWRYFVALSLVLAGRAVDYIDVTHARRSELREAARRLGIPSELHLTHAARTRIDSELREQRISKRLGPRRKGDA